MKIEYDPRKRQWTLDHRGLDFERVSEMFEGFYLTKTDDRKDYGEVRHIIFGEMDNTPVVAVWTPRGDAVRVISMRIADDEEREIFWQERERYG
jgi:hypothetical protein